MRKVHALMLSVLAISFFALIGIATPASATKPVQMNIEVEPLVFEPEFEELPNGLMKLTFYTEQAWTGDWVGINRQSGSAIIRSEDRGKGIATIKARGTFEGTVDGKEGTVSFYMRNNIRSDGSMFSAKITILSGTGELENIRGTGTVGEMELQIWVHFDP